MDKSSLFDLSFLSKMTIDDWVYLLIYMALLLGTIVLLDTILNLIKGYYMIISGVFVYLYLLRNRILAREKDIA